MVLFASRVCHSRRDGYFFFFVSEGGMTWQKFPDRFIWQLSFVVTIRWLYFGMGEWSPAGWNGGSTVW